MFHTLAQPGFDISIFEVHNQMINLTKMCQSFDLEIRRWLQNPSTKQFLSALQADDTKSVIAIFKGGNGIQGTFGTREVALKVAQWISPEFEVFCIRKLDELFQTGKTELKPNRELSRLEILEMALETEKENLKLKQELENAKPAIAFQSAVQNSVNSISIGEFAKILKIGEFKFFSWLRDNGYLLKHPKNVPAQKYIENGYFKCIEKTHFNNQYKTYKTYIQTFITGKGQIVIQRKFLTNTHLLLN